MSAPTDLKHAPHRPADGPLHQRALRWGIAVVDIADRQGGVVTWEQNDRESRKARYPHTIAGWMRAPASPEPCLVRANNIQRHPPLRVTAALRAWVEAHRGCLKEDEPS
jgi:hypothetical protein